ncbi:hypothetical protein BDY19DRAFT_922216 [Irpex rosettiformis]|uniref:Uncharacterized protein n=1 Tax=Irpex rosettiformis TaxID=378272 RepID=A0ACB8UFD8_9APHY|nr:hypothetical protein BDY19DRAFT_922216 [Irpex rosettiformis]
MTAMTMADSGFLAATAIPNTIVWTPLLVLRVLSPFLLLGAALSTIFSRPSPPHSPSPITSVVVATRTPRRAVILPLLSLSALTFLLDGLTFVAFTVISKEWPEWTGIEVGAVEGLVAFAGLAAVGAWKDVQGVDVWFFRRISFGITWSLLLDIAQVILLGLAIKKPLNVASLLHLAFPAFRTLVEIPLLFALGNPRISYLPVQNGNEEATDSTHLLQTSESTAVASTGLSLAPEASKYGTFRTGRSLAPSVSNPTTRTPTPAPSAARIPHGKGASRSQDKEEINPDPSWGELIHRLGRITPYLWPSRSRALQLLAGLCIGLVVIGRFVNFLVPLAFAQVVRIFEQGSKVSPWPYLFAYVGLRFLQSSGGLAALRDTLWAPVLQYSDREMSLLSFNHLLNLSFNFHTHRKTGEVLRILDRGAAINHTFELLLFNIVPTFVDIFVALIFFTIYFEWTLSLLIFFVFAAYVAASVILTRYRTKLRRQMNERDIVTRGIHTDCLLNYETVKYFNGEEHESDRYKDAIRQYQTVEYKVIASLNLLNLVQNFIITVGLLVGSMIVALRVVHGQSQPHEFVFFITYLAQLYGPLNMLGFIYRSVNQSLVDTEKLLKLLNEPTDVNDKPDASDLIVEDGSIEFENVTFSYDGRTTALNGVSFKVPKRSSVALVGESGSGKSTILRLLYRFYDLKGGEGRILIDGKDIRDVTQASLRKAIGVVPQDPVLFNASIGYNIAYGKFDATTEEIEAAAKAAQMHERIVTFPDGYETKVGERGIRLSGGEKQRVAIARTLLKNPPILLLDEATSALDTSTEKDIQNALQHLVEGRSSLSIAHRLSTIKSADLILVLKDGQIVEQGNHTELLAMGGHFASMWADQVSANEDTSPTDKKSALAGYSVDGELAVPDTITAEPLVATPEVHAVEIPADGEVSGPAVVATTELTSADGTVVDEPIERDERAKTEPSAPVAFPSSGEEAIAFPTGDAPAAVTAPSSEAKESGVPLAFPSGGRDSPAPAGLAFPGSDSASVNTPSIGGTPGVTFQNVPTPARDGASPDLDQDGKRRRTLSTQGIQRLARRISISGRRQGSSTSIPAAIFNSLKRDNSSVSRGSGELARDEANKEGSVREDGSLANSANASPNIPNDSPSGSVSSDINKTKAKKDKKKEKKRKSTNLGTSITQD